MRKIVQHDIGFDPDLRGKLIVPLRQGARNLAAFGSIFATLVAVGVDPSLQALLCQRSVARHGSMLQQKLLELGRVADGFESNGIDGRDGRDGIETVQGQLLECERLQRVLRHRIDAAFVLNSVGFIGPHVAKRIPS